MCIGMNLKLSFVYNDVQQDTFIELIISNGEKDFFLSSNNNVFPIIMGNVVFRTTGRRFCMFDSHHIRCHSSRADFLLMKDKNKKKLENFYYDYLQSSYL